MLNYQNDNLIFIKKYYEDDGARRLAHLVKQGNNKAIFEMALDLSALIPSKSIIIPTPSSKGYATETLIIANQIAKLKNCIVKDIVKGKKRESLYEMKKENKDIPEDFFGFYLTEDKPLKKVFIIDTVYDTGETLNAITKLIPNSILITHSKS